MMHPSFKITGVLVLLTTPMLFADIGSAQSGERGTMIIGDDQARHVLHYAEPDLDLVLEPDLRPSDARIFARELKLSDAQRAVVKRLLEEYLEALRELIETKHPERAAEDAARPAPPPRKRADQPSGEAPPPGPESERDAIDAIILDELRKAGFEATSLDDLPFSPNIRIGLRMPGPGAAESAPMEAGPPEPSLDVSLSFESEDDALTEELRARLQEAADRIVPRITEHVKADLAARRAEGGGMAGPDPAARLREKWRDLTELRARIKAFLDARDALRARLMTSVQTMLAEEQMTLWPAFERTLLRIKTLPLGRFDGERTDLLAVLEKVETGETTLERIAPLLESYELQLHAALTRRNDLLEDIDAEVDLALYEGDGDRALMLTDRAIRARIAVRALNEQYRDLIAGELSEPQAARFRRAALEVSYPTVYRRTLGEEVFEQVMQFDELGADLRAAVEAMKIDYDQQLGRINDRIARTIRSQQPKHVREAIEQAIADSAEAAGADDAPTARDTIADDFRRRQQLDVRTLRTLYGLLTPGQVAGLPKIPGFDITQPVTAEHAEGGGLDSGDR
ncbi:MAG: hypothetical protein SYC29_02540 [Planctomycetota bacterium]|nr:hypothetical protein [Planctomycetota bacterium]